MPALHPGSRCLRFSSHPEKLRSSGDHPAGQGSAEALIAGGDLLGRQVHFRAVSSQGAAAKATKISGNGPLRGQSLAGSGTSLNISRQLPIIQRSIIIAELRHKKGAAAPKRSDDAMRAEAVPRILSLLVEQFRHRVRGG